MLSYDFIRFLIIWQHSLLFGATLYV